MQSEQGSPLAPQAVSDPPMLHTPFESQHPVQNDEQLIPASTGALQILMGSVGATASAPHVSPRVRQSVSDVHSWIGPISVDGHGPRWQLVVIVTVPQQASPLRHSAVVVQVSPEAPLLLELAPPLEPPTAPLLLTMVPPLLELPLTTPPPPPVVDPLPEGGSELFATPSASLDSPASEALSSLPPHADTPASATATPSNVNTR